VLNSLMLRACALLTTANVLCCAAVSQAGLFDRFKSKPRRTVEASATAAVTRRGQSPMGEQSVVWQQPAAAASSIPWYSDGYQTGMPGGMGDCCGPDDKCAWYTRTSRKKCDQTYYPPVPPYCFPCYGYNPTCWRRMQECCICPREELPPPFAPRMPKRRAPKIESIPALPTAPPEPMDDPAAMRLRTKSGRLASARSQQTAEPSAGRSRWTSYTEALPEIKENEDVSEAPADTLEEMMEAEEDNSTEASADEGEVVSEETLAEDETEAAADETEEVEQ
jgi:hypothetical protein